jgi:hypothetical protein
MPDIHATSTSEHQSTPAVGEPSTLTDVWVGQPSEPVRAPSPSRVQQSGGPQVSEDPSSATGGETRVLRVASASDRGNRNAFVALVLVALIAVTGVFLALRPSVAPQTGGRAHAGRARGSVRVARRRSDSHGQRRGRRVLRVVRSRRTKPPVRVSAPNSSFSELCAGLCGSQRTAETGVPAPLRSGAITQSSRPEEEAGVEFGFEE